MACTHPVGIDLGTTQSVAAYVTSDGSTEVLQNSEGESLTPSVVLIDEGRAVVGKRALEASVDLSGQVAECAKRDMGLSSYSKTVGNRLIPPEVIQGFILRKLRQDIILRLGDNFQAVVAVPAYFDERRRQATVNAAKMSGIEVLDIVNEPTAAALAFGQALGYLSASGAAKKKMNVLVYDLGGGTFDVTVVQLEGSSVTTLATDGDVRLGGYDWDLRLVEFAKKAFLETYPDSKPFDEAFDFNLRRSVERIKHKLSEVATETAVIEHEGRILTIEFSRRQFEELTADLLERTAFTTRQTLREASRNWSDIDRLLLVGGSTRMPMVRQMLSDLSGLSPDTTIHPDEAVARGAAVFAHTKMREKGSSPGTTGLKITDVVSHSLGIEGIDERTLRKENVSLIPRNCPLPKEVVREFVTKEEDQKNVLVRLLEGESRQPEYCSELGRATIKNLPDGLPKGTKINVAYRLDSNGRLSVNALMPDIGSAAKIELQRLNSLSNSRIDRWKKIVCCDGGYTDSENIDRMIESVLNEYDSTAVDVAVETEAPDEAVNSKKISLDPAVAAGAPLAASEGLKRSLRSHKRENSLSPMKARIQERKQERKRRSISLVIRVVGHVLFSLVGIVVGLFVLCWLRPEFREKLPIWLKDLFTGL